MAIPSEPKPFYLNNETENQLKWKIAKQNEK